MAERCPTCGGAVKIVGETTPHYEPVVQEGVSALLERIAWLERELADCTRDCRKAGARFERALDLLVELDRYSKRLAPLLQMRLRNFLESE